LERGMDDTQIIELGKEAVRIEIEGLSALLDQVGPAFAKAVRLIAGLEGKAVLTGVGKSGIIARKVASTMVSIGIPAVFMHPVDGLHGDLGSIMGTDAVVIFSNSGRTREILDLLDALAKIGVPVVSVTSDPSSPMAERSDIVLQCRVAREACNLNLAPTASTTAQLALGDALAVVVSRIKGFDTEAFRALHPAGELGRQLMARISQIMITGRRIPLVAPDTPLERLVREMTDKGLGFTLVADAGDVVGMITDGDLRRVLLKHGNRLEGLVALDIMTPNPKRIEQGKLAIDALDMMEKHQITSLVVTDEQGVFQGVVHLHDLLGRGKLGFR